MENRPSEDKVSVAVQAPNALVRVEGRATFKVAGALKQFGQSAMGGGCTTFILDMADCSGMDSTFMGVLAGLATRLRRQDGEMAMLNLNARTRGLVATLGLDHIVSAFESGQEPERLREASERARRMRALAAGKEDKTATARTMLEAHEQLVSLDPENLPRFRDVLTFLREDLKSAEGGS